MTNPEFAMLCTVDWTCNATSPPSSSSILWRMGCRKRLDGSHLARHEPTRPCWRRRWRRRWGWRWGWGRRSRGRSVCGHDLKPAYMRVSLRFSFTAQPLAPHDGMPGWGGALTHAGWQAKAAQNAVRPLAHSTSIIQWHADKHVTCRVIHRHL